jgi:hypothetical protein
MCGFARMSIMRHTGETTAFGEATDGGGMRAKDRLYVVVSAAQKLVLSAHLFISTPASVSDKEIERIFLKE